MAGWSAERIEAFRRGLYEFLSHCYINSKETGGHTCLGENIYRAQNWFLDSLFDALEKDIHEIDVIKSRQLGLSTISRATSLFWLGIHEGLQGALVFDTAYNTAAARREILSILKGLPPHLHFPGIAKGGDNRDALILENG